MTDQELLRLLGESAARMNQATHPGTVLFVDEDTGHEQVRPADGMPDWFRFGSTADGHPVPVVRVTERLDGGQRTLRKYGPAGEELQVVVHEIDVEGTC